MRLSSSITRFRGRTDGRMAATGGGEVLPESENMSAASSDHFETLLRANLLRLYLSPIGRRHGLGGWGKNGCSVCVCVHVCCNSCMWYEVRVGGRGRGWGQEVCQQNQKQERLIWPDKVDSVTNHSGLWSGQDPRLPEEGQRPANDSTPVDESVYGNKQQSVVGSEGFSFSFFVFAAGWWQPGFFVSESESHLLSLYCCRYVQTLKLQYVKIKIAADIKYHWIVQMDREAQVESSVYSAKFRTGNNAVERVQQFWQLLNRGTSFIIRVHAFNN